MKMFRKLTPTAEINTIMIARTDELGDVILTLPLARAIKERRPDLELSFLVRPYISHLVDRIPEIDRTVTLPANGKIRSILKERRPDAIIFAHADPKLAMQAARSKIDVRIGPGYRLFSSLFTRWVYDRRSRFGSHEAEFELNMLEPLFDGPFDLQMPELPVMEEAAEEARAHRAKVGIGDTYVIVHPIGRPDIPGYPLSRWAEVGRALLDGRDDISLVITSGNGERDRATELLNSIDRPDRTAIIDTLSPNGVSELLRDAACFVSSASDGAHLAALVRTPVVALYPGAPPNWPQRRRPLGDSVTTLVPERNEQLPAGETAHAQNPEVILSRIGVERIVDEVRKVVG